MSYAYDIFPMATFTGSQRAFSFAKYIQCDNKKLVVLSFRNRMVNPQQEGNYGERIYRVLDLLATIERGVQNLKEKILHRSKKSKLVMSKTENKRRIKLHKRLFYIPDRQLYWAICAFNTARRLHKKEKFDVVLTTSPPESVHVVGWMLKNLLGIPWVADLRDGWMFEPYLEIRKKKGLRQRVERLMESKLLSQANKLTVTTDPIAKDLVDRLNIPKQNIFTIHNGFDQDEWKLPSLAPTEIGLPFDKKNALYMIHMGRLSAARNDINILPFLKALQNLHKNGSELQNKIVIIFVGVETNREIKIVKKMGLENIVYFHPPVPKTLAVRIMKGADVQLLVTSSFQKSIATSKLFDYMASKKPVLALAQNNAAAKIVEDTNIGLTVSPANIPEIENALKKIFEWWQKDAFPFFSKPQEIGKYNRKIAAKKMFNVLNF